MISFLQSKNENRKSADSVPAASQASGSQAIAKRFFALCPGFLIADCSAHAKNQPTNQVKTSRNEVALPLLK
jgi:hypothetical protein